MKFSENKRFILIAAIAFLLLSVEQVQASQSVEFHYDYQNMSQRHEDVRQFELSAGQARSKVEHTLVNFLLGQTVDQYLEFGEEDITSRKNFKRLKLRLNNHRAIFVYQYTFY